MKKTTYLKIEIEKNKIFNRDEYKNLNNDTKLIILNIVKNWIDKEIEELLNNNKTKQNANNNQQSKTDY
jgi:hypothetical protein